MNDTKLFLTKSGRIKKRYVTCAKNCYRGPDSACPCGDWAPSEQAETVYVAHKKAAFRKTLRLTELQRKVLMYLYLNEGTFSDVLEFFAEEHYLRVESALIGLRDSGLIGLKENMYYVLPAGKALMEELG